MYQNNIKKSIHFKTIYDGINETIDLAKITIGAKGRNVVLEEEYEPYHRVTNDGASIALRTWYEDPVMALGDSFVKEMARRSNKESGDGSTTSMILLQAILKEAQKQNASGMEVKKSLDALIPFIEQKIDEQKKVITENEVGTVASISAEDEELGKIIQEMYQEITKDGTVELDFSNTAKTFFTVKDGVILKNASISDTKLFNKDKKAQYENPLILITKQKVTLADIDPLMTKISKADNGKKKSLVIYYYDIEPNIESTLVATHQAGIMDILLIKAPLIWKDFITEDFAKVTGATIITNNLREAELSDLGTCGIITTDRRETKLNGTLDVSEHIQDLMSEGDDDSLRRACWLKAKTAVLKLGSYSGTDMTRLRDKAEDAINAARLSLEDGVVAGGGVCLLNVANSLKGSLGADVLSQALTYPIKQIIENAEKDPNLFSVMSGGTKGFNARTGEIVDMWEAGIIDPAKTMKNAIISAISIAGTILTSEACIVKQPETEEQKAVRMADAMRKAHF